MVTININVLIILIVAAACIDNIILTYRAKKKHDIHVMMIDETIHHFKKLCADACKRKHLTDFAKYSGTIDGLLMAREGFRITVLEEAEDDDRMVA